MRFRAFIPQRADVVGPGSIGSSCSSGLPEGCCRSRELASTATRRVDEHSRKNPWGDRSGKRDLNLPWRTQPTERRDTRISITALSHSGFSTPRSPHQSAAVRAGRLIPWRRRGGGSPGLSLNKRRVLHTRNHWSAREPVPSMARTERTRSLMVSSAIWAPPSTSVLRPR
jgi:hypothetical protein